MGDSQPILSVVVSTFNRSGDLERCLDAVLAQQDSPPHEVIVVDNNSTDDTRGVVERRQADRPHLRYVFEPRQGLPHARNAGIAAAAADVVAFTDDDIVVAPDWVASIARAFERHPEADCIGGRVLPRWPAGGPPAWLSPAQLAPLALQDKGTAEMRVDRSNAAPCLIGANFAFRRRAFERVGLFDPDYTRTQDREIQLRLWDAGGIGLYTPDIVTYVNVPAERLTKEYFRLWYTRAGRFHSRMGLLDRLDHQGRMVDRPAREATLFGAPAYLYRQLAAAVAAAFAKLAVGDEAGAFLHENRARYLASYIKERWRAQRPASPVAACGEVARFLGRRLSRRPVPVLAARSSREPQP